jgi:hypothetical protein
MILSLIIAVGCLALHTTTQISRKTLVRQAARREAHIRKPRQ